MGLIEQIQSGSRFTRKSVTFNEFPNTGFRTEFGASYILLGMSCNTPGRLRLYSDSASVAIDAPRPSSSFEYSASVGLNLDARLTPSTQSLVFNPPVLAYAFSEGKTWYNYQPDAPSFIDQPITVTYYPIEYSLPTTSRTFLNIPDITGVTLTAYQTSSGNHTTPKSFLILNAVSDANIRVRLYSRPIEEIDTSEKNRPFISESVSGSHLICDMLLESSSYLYNVSPILQAYNLEEYLNGKNRVGYILENVLGSTQTNVYTGIRIYPIED